jgi:hypothetical protein
MEKRDIDGAMVVEFGGCFVTKLVVAVGCRKAIKLSNLVNRGFCLRHEHQFVPLGRFIFLHTKIMPENMMFILIIYTFPTFEELFVCSSMHCYGNAAPKSRLRRMRKISFSGSAPTTPFNLPIKTPRTIYIVLHKPHLPFFVCRLELRPPFLPQTANSGNHLLQNIPNSSPVSHT